MLKNNFVLPQDDPLLVIELYRALGYSLLMIQSLELALSQYMVFVHKIRPDLAVDEIEQIFERASKKTFGGLFNELKADHSLSEDLKTKLKELVEDRNWLVHKISVDNQKDMHAPNKLFKLISRVNNIGDKAIYLSKLFINRTDEIIIAKGYMTEEEFDKKTQAIIDSWNR